MSKYNNSEYLDMIHALRKYDGDFKKACAFYNASHCQKTTPHRIRMTNKHLLEHGQFQPPLASQKVQGKINRLAEVKAKHVPLKPSSRISDSGRKGKTVTGATKSSSQQVSSQKESPQQVSSQEKSPHTDLESLRDKEKWVDEKIHKVETRMYIVDNALKKFDCTCEGRERNVITINNYTQKQAP